jgi:hypothetical protein
MLEEFLLSKNPCWLVLIAVLAAMVAVPFSRRQAQKVSLPKNKEDEFNDNPFAAVLLCVVSVALVLGAVGFTLSYWYPEIRKTLIVGGAVVGVFIGLLMACLMIMAGRTSQKADHTPQ